MTRIDQACRLIALIVLLTLSGGFSGSPLEIGAKTPSGQEARQTAPAPALNPSLVPYFTLPARLDFCGEPVPLEVPEVRERLDREFMIVVYNRAQVYLWLKRMERYFPWVEKQLAQNGLPDDLKWVAVAESDLMLSAVSPAGAAGPWQFIASTGNNYGLSQSAGVDERYDFEQSTASAFRYLRDLHGIFNNWTLAAASYNCGEKRVQDEMRKQKAANYYSMKLPAETERYIFRIAAIKEVLSHPEQYGYVLPKGEGYPPIPVDRVRLNLSGPVSVAAAANAAGITYREMKRLNPSLISDSIPKSFNLKVPEGRGKDLQSRLQKSDGEAAVRSTPAKCSYHKVARGETLSGIAGRYDVSARDIRGWNKIRGETVRIGQVLKIYR